MFETESGKNYKKNKVSIAGYVDKELAQKLDLLLLFKKMSRTDLVNDTVEKAVKKYPIEYLVGVFAKKIYKEWKTKNSRKKFKNFIITIEKQLRTKKITNEYINNIISEAKKVYNQNEKN